MLCVGVGLPECVHQVVIVCGATLRRLLCSAVAPVAITNELTRWNVLIPVNLQVAQVVKKFPHVLWYPKVHYRIHRSLAFISVLRQISVQSVPPHPSSLIFYLFIHYLQFGRHPVAAVVTRYISTDYEDFTLKFTSGGLHEKHVVATWNVGNHPGICSRTQGNQEKPETKWPVTGTSGY